MGMRPAASKDRPLSGVYVFITTDDDRLAEEIADDIAGAWAGSPSLHPRIRSVTVQLARSDGSEKTAKRCGRPRCQCGYHQAPIRRRPS